MSAENLCRSLRAALSGRPDQAPLDSEGFRLARSHRLAGTLYHMRTPLGHVERDEARQAWASQAAAHVLRCEALSRFYPNRAPPPLVFKGGDLAENLYGDPGARRMSDLDLLLPEAAFEEVLALMAADADQVSAPRAERFAQEPDYEVGLRFGDASIELHRHVQPLHRGGPITAALFARSTPGRLGAVEVRYPAPTDRLLLWLTNQAKGSFFGDLADLVDLSLILRALPSPVPWAALTDQADRTGLARPFRLALRRLHASGLAEIPPGLTMATAGDRLAESLLPPWHEPPAVVPAWRFQALKLYLAEPGRRPGVVLRIGATALRRAYNQVSGTKTMSPG